MGINRLRRLPWVILAVTAVVALAAVACTTEVEVPVEKRVVETVIVEKEVPGAKVVETVIVEVEKEVPVEKEVVVTATPLPPTRVPAKGPVTWTIGFPDDITSLNVWDIMGPASTAYNFYAMLNQYPALMALSDQRFDYVPTLAKGFPSDVVQEGNFWTATVEMADGAIWSDGESIDANDVVFTIATALEFELPGNWGSNIDSEVIDRAEAVDQFTVKFYFKSKPGLSRWQYGLAQTIIVAEHYWAPLVATARGEAEVIDRQNALYGIKPVDEPKAGELIFEKWEPGAFVSLKKNPAYYWQDSTVVEYASGAYAETVGGKTFNAYGDPGGDVSLELTRSVDADAVNYSVFSSQDAAILALRAGEIDYFLSPLGLTAGLKQQVTGQPGIATIENPSNGFRYLAFNLRRAPMDNAAFRKAVATLIDKEFLCEKILQNAAFPIYTAVPEGNGFWWNPDVPQVGKGLTREERINEVVTLLTAAGFTWETQPAWNPDGRKVDAGSGLKDPSGNPVTELEILTPSAGYDPLRATSGIWIEQWLKEAGIPVKANLTGFNVIVPRVFEEQDFDMWILGWGLTIYPDYLADFFHSNQAVLGGLNAGGYSKPEFDAMADDFTSETDLNAARVKAFTLQEYLADDLPYVTLFATPIIEAYRTETVNFAFTDVLDGLQNYFQSINGPLSHTAVD